jgi:hypothetical protein
VINPYAASVKVKIDPRPDTPPVPPEEDSVGLQKAQRQPPVKQEMPEETDKKEVILGADELKAIRRKFEEDRVLKEIQGIDVKVSFGGAAWETEVGHFSLSCTCLRLMTDVVYSSPHTKRGCSSWSRTLSTRS